MFLDLDLTALYTFVGDPQESDTLEVALAALVPLNHKFDLEAEVVHAFGTGGIRGQPGTTAPAVARMALISRKERSVSRGTSVSGLKPSQAESFAAMAPGRLCARGNLVSPGTNEHRRGAEANRATPPLLERDARVKCVSEA